MKFLAVAAGLLWTMQITEARAQVPDTTAVAAAEAAARSWLTLVDAGQFAESWDSAAAAFKTAVTKIQWQDAVRSARSPVGPLGARTVISAELHDDLPNAPPGRYVVLEFRTEAGGGQTVIETVTPMQDPDGRWRVSGYYIRPN